MPQIEVVIDAAAATQRPAKGLSDRVALVSPSLQIGQTILTTFSQPKTAAPKAATGPKNAARGGKAARGRNGRGRAGRPKPKTADELDAEMADYFDPNAPAGSNTENVPATNGAAGADDIGMDEIS